MNKTYSPSDHEDTLYEAWEKSGFFNPDICVEKGITQKDAEPFSIMLPPPNATGTLHIGHSSVLAVEDLLTRYHRMRGNRTLWLPGTDHAALATQEKVERLLWDTEKKTRHDLGREEFLKRVDDFVENSRNTMRRQMRKMGSSLDWSREAFTLDKERNLAVRTAFKKMYDDGIIYRGDRIVNWDPKMQTTVSDDEIKWKEETIPFYYFQYGPFVIGTSRPETKFGDKYVVVHPDDERYSHYKDGETFAVEWVNGTITATLIKDPAVDMHFGSGAMTITPWHDAVDFDIAEQHQLSKEQIIGYDGKMLPLAGADFVGLDIFEARKKIIERLREKNLLVKVEENYVHNVATNERGGGIIEPQIKRQWFINVNQEFDRDGRKMTLKKLMQDAVRNGAVKIIPEQFEKTYFHWIDNLRDWCISRQIWYGHRIPVYYCKQGISHSQSPISKKCQKPIVCIEDIHQCLHCGGEIEQDSDSLDTWFSSGLWTFSTLGWPNKTQDLKTFHPTSVLNTAYDILFPWVSRMILMSTYLLQEIPFKTVYLNGLIRDEQGRKMSKSIGNVIDPLDIIPKYGTDAIRLSLLIGSSPGNDLKLGEEKIAQYRNFTNKLWNIARFILADKNGTRGAEHETPEEISQEIRDPRSAIRVNSDSSHWILSQFATLIEEVTADLDAYRFSQAGEKLREFTWSVFADWYLEIAKFETNAKETGTVLLVVFEDLLKLWHPFMPFVTETIWQEMRKEDPSKKEFLMIASWPDAKKYQALLQEKSRPSFSLILAIIRTVRNLRAEHRITPNTKVPVTLSVPKGDAELSAFLKNNAHLMQALRTGASSITLAHNFAPSENFFSHPASDRVIVFVSAENAFNAHKEKMRLEKELSAMETLIKNTEARLANPQYREKAPAAIVAQTEKTLEEYLAKRESIARQREEISK